MAATYRLEDTAYLAGRGVFVDANVLIYLFWPTGRYQFEANYARVFRSLLKQGNGLFVDFGIVSEVVNRILRIEHKKINPAQKFKDFRDSDDGKQALDDIYVIVRNEILRRFNVVGRVFDKQEIESLLVVDELDFVDKATVVLCRGKALVLLTNDRDFKNTELDILTGNPAILN